MCLIDLSPINLHAFAQQGFRTVAGDATDTDILELAQVESASVIVVCVPDDEAASRIVQNLRTANSSCQVLVRCRYQVNASRLRKSGASQVVSEEAEAGNALVNVLADLDKDTGNGNR